jgi:hypothetical protein
MGPPVEHRSELEDILLNGLPEQERRHVVRVMEQVTAEKRRYLQSVHTSDNKLIDLAETDEQYDEDPNY